jgi:hypothetical protein
LKEFFISGYHSADIEAGRVGQESVDVMWYECTFLSNHNN